MPVRVRVGPDRRPPARHRRRIGDAAALVLAIVCVLVVLAGTALAWYLPSGPAREGSSRAGSQVDDPPSGTPDERASTSPTPFRPDAPIGPPDRAPMPDPAKLTAALRGPLADPAFDGPAELEVRDLTTGRLLVDRNRGVPQSPASTAKLGTAAVVLTELGPNARISTRVYLAGGKLYLVGGGDPTLTRGASPPGRPAAARIDDLARQIRAAGIRETPAVIGDARLFGGPALAPGWRDYYLNSQISPISALAVDSGKSAGAAQLHTPTPSLAATQALGAALGRSGVKVGSVTVGALPPGGRVVAEVQSPPVAALVEQMLTLSDNELAEALGRLAALHAGRSGDFAGSSATVLAGMQRLGLPTQGTVLRDSSGLSHEDRMSPALLVAILRMASDPARPELRSILRGLPVAGRTGTLDPRYHSADTSAGVDKVHAKSGRILGVSALAGVVTTKDGRRLAFSARGPSDGLTDGEHALDRIATTLATCGCR